MLDDKEPYESEPGEPPYRGSGKAFPTVVLIALALYGVAAIYILAKVF